MHNFRESHCSQSGYVWLEIPATVMGNLRAVACDAPVFVSWAGRVNCSSWPGACWVNAVQLTQAWSPSQFLSSVLLSATLCTRFYLCLVGDKTSGFVFLNLELCETQWNDWAVKVSAAKLNNLGWVLEIHIIERGNKSRRVSSDLYMQPWYIYTLTQTGRRTDR